MRLLLFTALVPALALADVTVNGSVSVSSLDGGLRLSDANGDGLVFADGRVDTGRDQPLFADRFVGTSVAANSKWMQSLSTMTATVATGRLLLNAGASVAANTHATLSSAPKFRGYVDGSVYVQVRAAPTNLPQTNAVAEIGLGNATANTAPTDGAFFRWTASGGFECVVNRGGAETSTSMTAPAAAGVYSIFGIRVRGDRVVCTWETPSSGASARTVMALDSAAPSAFIESPGAMLRVYTGATGPALAPQLAIGLIEVSKKVLDEDRPIGHVFAYSGQSAAFNPLTGAQATNHANSTAPVSATLSNTAAGYATLGGRYQFAAPAGAVTDYALFGFQVPTSFRFVITGVSISACNTGVAVATTPTSLEWALGVGSTAVSLATTDGTAATPTSAPRRIPLGKQVFAVGAAVEFCDTEVSRTFISPVSVESGRFVHVILAVPVGTATASQIIRGTVTFDGYFE